MNQQDQLKNHPSLKGKGFYHKIYRAKLKDSATQDDEEELFRTHKAGLKCIPTRNIDVSDEKEVCFIWDDVARTQTDNAILKQAIDTWIERAKENFRLPEQRHGAEAVLQSLKTELLFENEHLIPRVVRVDELKQALYDVCGALEIDEREALERRLLCELGLEGGEE